MTDKQVRKHAEEIIFYNEHQLIGPTTVEDCPVHITSARGMGNEQIHGVLMWAREAYIVGYTEGQEAAANSPSVRPPPPGVEIVPPGPTPAVYLAGITIKALLADMKTNWITDIGRRAAEIACDAAEHIDHREASRARLDEKLKPEGG